MFDKRYKGLGLRGKLLIATLSVFILPVVSYYYLIELETFLKDNQSKSQLETSRIMAGFFDNNYSISHSNKIHNGQRPIYVNTLDNMPVIDAYAEDWQQPGLKKQSFSSSTGDEKFNFYIGIKDNNLFVFLSVIDDSSRYNLPEYQNHHDYIIITLSDSYTLNKRNYYLETEAPGWFTATQEKDHTTQTTSPVRGEWLENKNGYQLEFMIPLTNFTDMMTIDIYDNGVSFSSLDKKISSKTSPFHLNPLVIESPLLSQKLQKFQQKLANSNTRLYIINQHYEILARANQFTFDNFSFRQANTFITHLANIYRAIINLDIQNQRYSQYLIHLHGKEIDLALSGSNKSSSAWLDGSNSDILILSTASAIKDSKDNIIGALIIEKTNASILAIQDQTLEKLLFISLILFFSTGIILLIYSGRLVHRILHLKESIEHVMSREGKLKHEFRSLHGHDEIGQLSQSFSSLFQQLNRYTEYLESMVRKLSHELGTPLSIIKSSLENMQMQGISKDNSIFLQRAMDGSHRLSRMLSRMSEASRLEQALQNSHKEIVDINQFLSQYIESIQLANPAVSFSVNLPEKIILSLICPELIAQLLDKLISNAISFHIPTSTIEIILSENDSSSTYTIELFNCGQWIPDKIKSSLFDSMVSIRSTHKKKTSKEVNLGLGLHIAQLISSYHNGKIFYLNRKKENRHYLENGVSFIVKLKMSKHDLNR
ncbi:MAG: hypothetical protein KZQ83_04295 [gamma proteobacterium symbiont of Taylorina sp.]|nr:hypothetical protein [gamma proteobacterium symbiont of Taylorina sp.]